MVLGLVIVVPVLLDGLLALLHGLPEILVENTQLRHVLGDPLRLGVHPRLAFTRVWVLDEPLAVPDQFADIHLIVENAVAPFWIAIDCTEAPIAAARRGYSILVQFEGDPLGGFSGGIVAEDPADDISLKLIDGPVTADRLTVSVELLYHIITIRVSATRLA